MTEFINKNDLTAEILRKHVIYYPTNGIMIWRTPRGRRGSRFVGREAGYTNNGGYRIVRINGFSYKAHRLAWLYVHERWPDGEIDHRNGNCADNRIRNLREATRLQNIANSKPHGGRPFKGITFVKPSGRWRAQISINRKMHYLGYFNTAEEAHAVYVAKAREVHGEFARAI